MSNIYLKIEGSTGLLFEQSKTQAEGFERVEFVNPSTGEKGITYKRYLKEGVFGLLSGVKHKINEFESRKIQSIGVALTNGEDRFFLDIPLLNQKGDIGSYAESFIMKLPFLQEGKAYRIYPYAIDNKDNDRKNYGIAINRAKLSDNAIDKVNKIQTLTRTRIDKETKEVIPGDVPAVDWQESFDGKLKPNSDKKNAALFKVFQDNLIEFKGGGSNVKTFNYKEEEEQDEVQPKKQEEVVEKATPSKEQKQTPKNPGGAAAQPNTAFDTKGGFTPDEDDDDLPF